MSRVASSSMAKSSSRTACQRTSSAFVRPQQISAFSTSSAFRKSLKAQPESVDQELAAKLGSEIEFEKGIAADAEVPASIEDFQKNSQFKVEDVSGNDKVVLTRTYNNEKITISFSIADLHQMGNESLPDEDMALNDEDLEDEPKSSKQKQNKMEQEEMDEDEDMDDLEDDEHGPMPNTMSVVIEKPNNGALRVEVSATNGAIMVDNVQFYQDAKLAHSKSPESEYAASELYTGPPFGTLDEDLQLLMERYLEERGVNEALAMFVPDFMENKEQKEYLNWLQKIKGFVEA